MANRSSLVILPSLLLLAGCGNTLNGAKQDVASDAQKTAAAAHQVGQAVKDVPQNIGGAVTVTPEVKTAIVRDPVLNDPKNVINVSSKDKVVHLVGHVQTEDMKKRAEEDARVVLDKRHPDYAISNDLTIQPGS